MSVADHEIEDDRPDLRHCDLHECWIIDVCWGCRDEAIDRAMEEAKCSPTNRS